MNKTSIARTLLSPRMRHLNKYVTEAERLQNDVLMRLLNKARGTEWGQLHGFDAIKNYEAFAAQCPLCTYDDLKPFIERMQQGESDVLWPGCVRWYAKSSGTTSERSKHIPVSEDSLQDTHYQGGKDTVVWHLHNNAHSRLFDGKGLILGGSYVKNPNMKDSLIGDLSAILIENISPAVNLVRVPKKETALLSDFEQKRERIARETMHEDVTNISGVPSWMLSVLKRVLEMTGKQSIGEVWPNLEVFFHGGVAFDPYNKEYARVTGLPDMQYMETYNASEGFFGIQDDPTDKAMSLMVDYGVFYEFIPMDKFGKTDANAVPLWGVEKDKDYAMVISTSSGLWRYVIGDTVRFTSKDPYKFVITGRTMCFINAFGEELIVNNAEKGLAVACHNTGAQVREYTAAPVYMNEEGKCRHQWLIEFSKQPDDMESFVDTLDKSLRELNSDYDAKRQKDITLQRLELVVARSGQFEDWLRSKGKLGGQHKVPRLRNDRIIIEEIMKLA